MHKSFEGVSVSGIVKPGEIYIFCDNLERGWQPEPLDYIYTIKSEAEILPALDMEMKILADTYVLKKYLRSRKISDDCHQVKMLCYDEEGIEFVFSLYLQRIISFEEKLKIELEIGL
jgi:hypothetical protein